MASSNSHNIPEFQEQDGIITTKLELHTPKHAPPMDETGGNDANDNDQTMKSNPNSEKIATEDGVQEQNQVYLTGWKMGVAVLGLSTSVFLMALDSSILATAIPKMTTALKSLNAVGWYGSAYLLTTAAFQVTYGKFYSYFPIKWVYLTAFGIFEIGSLICATAPNSTAFIIGRAIAGLGSAGLFSGAMIIISNISPLEKRPMYTGIISAMYGIASVAGPLMGGALTDRVSWRWCFYINLPCAVIPIVAILFLPISTKAILRRGGFFQTLKDFDVPGSLTFIPAIVCLLIALQWGGTQYEWSSWRVILLLVIFAVLFVAFVVIQIWQGDKAMLPPRIICKRSMLPAILFAFCNCAGYFILIYYIPIWFQAIKGTSAIGSGIRNLPMLLSMSISSIATGLLVTYFGYYGPFMIGSSIVTSIGAGLVSTWKPNTGSPSWIAFQIIFGAGMGLGLEQSLIAVQAIVDPADIPAGTALMVFTQSFGGTVFISAAQNLFEKHLISALSENVPSLDPQVVLNLGATGIRGAVTNGDLLGVIESYNDAIRHAFYIATGVAAASILGSITIEWKNLHANSKKDTPQS
ncbi:putative HC-toxin efflux carrier [Coleophoma cylindrospora]|uniref:Putative HC-toxin efflux carrier n=1 Tax=Coleophoma cylindrospora TaxID=1849047 RepID=A0A3D8RAE7_9HELO|nr:putative HC-toxin efflux carrier [Coleophoma cylindrospora]